MLANIEKRGFRIVFFERRQYPSAAFGMRSIIEGQGDFGQIVIAMHQKRRCRVVKVFAMPSPPPIRGAEGIAPADSAMSIVPKCPCTDEAHQRQQNAEGTEPTPLSRRFLWSFWRDCRIARRNHLTECSFSRIIWCEYAEVAEW